MSSLDVPVRDDRRWPLWLLRFSLTATALLLFGQAVLAGLFMEGMHSAFAMHREMATVSGIVLMVAIGAAVAARVLGRGARWPIAATLGLLGLMSLQAFAGFRSLVALHVPFGTVVIVLGAALAVWAWLPRPTPGGREKPAEARGGSDAND
ncbi:hypothetical protein [Agromyces sp. Marseille-Q5079]|uniref:hypothetical protein n=1 Tax=Agromyces sp. Marseille-Q5079 TaxID=3439059 RepID=UPI003D9C9EB4